MFSARPAQAFARAVLALLLFSPVTRPAWAQNPAQAPVIALSVVARDPLPGFRKADATRYLADQMRLAQAPGWSFAAAAEPALPPHDRIEWHFTLDPYAGGGIRRFFPMSDQQRLFGAHHLVTAEAMLYLGDEYQTLMFGQAAITGGADDKALAAFVQRMTQQLLGTKGAYRSIDMSGPAAAPRP